MDKFFKISERGSNVKTEIIAGLTTFFAMAYIVITNPNQITSFSTDGPLGQIWNAVYVASILVAIIGTLLMALYAKMPFAQACGMGLNSFFFVSFILPALITGGDLIDGYQAGLVIILVSGIVFLVFSLTGLRSKVAKALPECLKKAIPAGIGLFIAMIGFKNAGIIEDNQYTFVQFYDFHGRIKQIGTEVDGVMVTGLDVWHQIVPVVVALLGVLIIAILAKKGIKSNVIIGILASAVLYYLFMWEVPSFDMSNISQSFKDFANVGFLGVFNGDAWDAAFNSSYVGGVFSGIMLIVAFCLVDMFDTIGTLYGTASQANMLDENGDPVDVNKAMMCDSIGTVTGAVLGTSTCTTFVESAAGVGAGGRTGLTSVVTAACFAVCLFLSPVATLIPSCATAPALIYVGVLMMKGFGKIDMDDVTSAVPAFLTVIIMCLSYSISNGIGVGSIAYVLISLFTGKYSKKDIVVTIIAVLFAARFLLITM